MMTTKRYHRTSAFTLVELLVVMSIIAILIALLLPAIGTIRTNAKIATTKGQYNALDTGIELFRAESALGGSYPPSASDDPTERHQIANPFDNSDSADMPIAGAHLLVHALVGADLRGTPGFRDFDRDGRWSDDTYGDVDTKGAYSTASGTGDMLHSRYPAGSSGYVNEDMKIKNVKSLRQLEEDGVVVFVPTDIDKETKSQFLFVDSWQRPILYYRASRAARAMVRDDGSPPGVYNIEDNGLITGAQGGTVAQDYEGIDFGKGLQEVQGKKDTYSNIGNSEIPGAKDDIQGDPNYDGTFARFIHNSKIGTISSPSGRNTFVTNEPVRKDSYLLISAGADGIYGNLDDVVNWTRDTE